MPAAAEPLRVAIVGGGITGLAAAFSLEQRAGQRPVEITLLEASERLGGKLRSERVGELLLEQGPDALFAHRPGWRDYCRALGLEAELVRADARHRQSYVLWRGRLHPLPAGMEAGLPRSLSPLARTGLLSPLGKARAALEPLLPPARAEGDESVDALLRRRFGAEVAERVAAPLLGGVYSTDIRQLSLLATLPHLREAERRHGSLLRAARAASKPGAQADADPGSPFYSLRHGLEQLAAATVGRLARTQLRLSAEVRAVRPTPRGGYRLELADGERLAADRVILATPAFAAARALAEASPAAAQELDAIQYSSVVVVALAYPPGAGLGLPPGSGFVVAPEEPTLLSACSWSSRKWPHVAPDGELVVRCHLQVGRQTGLLDRPDTELLETVRAELRRLLDLSATPLVARVYRWPRAVPSYHVGHLDRLARVQQALSEHPGLVLAGAGYRGVGVPDCIRQGIEAAAQALQPDPWWLALEAASVRSPLPR